MKKIVEFESKPTALAAAYYPTYTAEDGTAQKLSLTGDETISTICPGCGCGHAMSFDEFILSIHGGDIWSTQMYCGQCSRNIVDNRNNKEAKITRNGRDIK